MLDRYDFWARPLGLRRIKDQLVGDAFIRSGAGKWTGAGSAAMEAYEDDGSLVLTVQAPGFKPEQLDVSVDRGILTIRGQAMADERHGRREYLVREHRTGSFARCLRLPPWVDIDGARATFEHGVLRLIFPKAERATPRRVPIATSEPAAVRPTPSTTSVVDTPARHPSTADGNALSSGTSAEGEPADGTPAASKGAKRRAANSKAPRRRAADRTKAAKVPTGTAS